MIALGPPPRRRRMSLTPMIDVVFLLLIFFMLAARFGLDGALTLATGGAASGAVWEGPPRLIEFAPDVLYLNGQPVTAEALLAALPALMPGADAPVVLRPLEGANLQHLVDLAEALRAAGLERLVLVEP